jgi:ubiquinone/menaquinone biosynthesis C-methylase UbiE
MKSYFLALSSIFFLAFMQCQAQQTSQQEEQETSSEEVYQMRSPSRDGIGKYYMGREISHVMGHQGASWLERNEREEEEKVGLALRNFPLDKTSVVADIGAGSGYYTFKIAKKVKEGKVFAVDIQPEMLAIIKEKIDTQKTDNVIPVKGDEMTPNLPKDSIDMVLFVDVYHELAYPREMMTSIYQSLKKGGKVVLLEYRAEDPTVPIKPLHKMSAAQVQKEMEVVGLHFVENKSMLPWQHLLVFEK